MVVPFNTFVSTVLFAYRFCIGNTISSQTFYQILPECCYCFHLSRVHTFIELSYSVSFASQLIFVLKKPAITNGRCLVDCNKGLIQWKLRELPTKALPGKLLKTWDVKNQQCIFEDSCVLTAASGPFRACASCFCSRKFETCATYCRLLLLRQSL